jgi:uncharacterized membrane protein YgcG
VDRAHRGRRVVVVVAGLDPAKWTPLLISINGLAATCIAAIGAEDAAEKAAGGQPEKDGGNRVVTTTTTVFPSTPLTPEAPVNAPTSAPPTSAVAILILSIFALFFAGAAGGCAASPTARWAQARDTLNTAEKTIVTQHRAGTISDADLVALDSSVQAARKALTAAQQQIDNSGGAATPAFEFYLDLTDSILDQLTNGKLNRVTTPASAGRTAAPKGSSDGSGGTTGGDSSGTGRDRIPGATGVAQGTERRVQRRAA